jgi:hypothetical protein
VLAALECLRVIREAGLTLPVHLEVINFTDDEGTWHSAVRGAGGGRRTAARDHQPRPHREHLFPRRRWAASGWICAMCPTPAAIRTRWPAILELHIEHGTRLETAGAAIGVVSNIVGRTTYEIVFHGQAGHSGTTDMYKRRDALRGAAQFITRAHDAMRARYGDGIFNCGDISVQPGKYNIIPSEARLIVEVRHIGEQADGRDGNRHDPDRP